MWISFTVYSWVITYFFAAHPSRILFEPHTRLSGFKVVSTQPLSLPWAVKMFSPRGLVVGDTRGGQVKTPEQRRTPGLSNPVAQLRRNAGATSATLPQHSATAGPVLTSRWVLAHCPGSAMQTLWRMACHQNWVLNVDLRSLTLSSTQVPTELFIPDA